MSIFKKIIEYVAGAEMSSATYKPTKAYTGTLPKGVVRKGSEGSDVKAVQSFLNWIIKAGLTVDGVAGKKTIAAIKKFQKRYGLKVDGIFGTKSKAKAQALIKQYKPKAESASSATTKTETTTTRTPQDKICAWAEMVANNGIFHYVRWKSSDKNTQTCPICKKRVELEASYDAKKNKYFLKKFKILIKKALGGNCIWFAFHCWRHGAKIKSKCNCGVISNEIWQKILKASDADALKIARKYVGIDDIEVIRNKGKAIPTSKL